MANVNGRNDGPRRPATAIITITGRRPHRRGRRRIVRNYRRHRRPRTLRRQCVGLPCAKLSGRAKNNSVRRRVNRYLRKFIVRRLCFATRRASTSRSGRNRRLLNCHPGVFCRGNVSFLPRGAVLLCRAPTAYIFEVFLSVDKFFVLVSRFIILCRFVL